jgi:hypothetical protein
LYVLAIDGCKAKLFAFLQSGFIKQTNVLINRFA